MPTLYGESLNASLRVSILNDLLLIKSLKVLEKKIPHNKKL